jgi:hypothetical protein
MEKPKTKSPSALSPKQAARVLSTKYERQLEQRVPGEENETEYATGQVERVSRRVTEDVAGGVRRYHDGRRKTKAQWKSAGQDTDPGGTEQPEGAEHPYAPKKRPTTEAGRTPRLVPYAAQANSRKKAPDASRPAVRPGVARYVAQRHRTGKTVPLRRKDMVESDSALAVLPSAQRRRMSASRQPLPRSNP